VKVAMPNIIALMSEHLLDIVFVLLGCAMGVFYGFYGWRGSVKDVDIKDSPRWKNLRWVFAVAAGTFFADLKAVVPTAEKGRLLELYAIGFFLSGFLFIFFWAVVIAINFLYMRFFDRDNLPPEPFSPVADYIFYGYSYYRARYEAAIEALRNDQFEQYKRNVQTFLPSYVQQLASAIAAVEGHKAASGETERAKIAKEILRSIRGVVVSYQQKTAGVEINANYMEVIPKAKFPVGDWDKVRFHFGDKERYPHFLALQGYAEDIETEDFILPVEDKNDTKHSKLALPGAPQAFMKGGGPIFVDDTENIHYPPGLPKEVVAQMQSYFKEKAFRSFVSIAIFGGGAKLGVVNVDSNKTRIFGPSGEQQDQIKTVLAPFCILLGQVLKR
jgi:hypothetical protein